jgi:hypothetical protein
VNIYDIELRGIGANAAGERGGELQGAKARGPAGSWDDIIEKPNVDLMAELLQFLGVMKHYTGGTGFTNAAVSTGN